MWREKFQPFLYGIYVLCLALYVNCDDSIQEKLISDALKAHNAYRKVHGVQKLTRDNALVRKARDWVDKAIHEKNFAEVKAGESVYRICATFKVPVTGKQISKAW